MVRRDPVGELRARVAPWLRHGSRRVVMTTDALRLGNLLYLWLHCHRNQAQGDDVRTLANSHTAPWDDLWGLTERGLVVGRDRLRVWDQREEIPERLHQRWGRDFTRDNLVEFAEDVLLRGPFRELVEPRAATLTINVRRGDYYANPGFRALLGFDYLGYLEAALDLAVSRDGAPDEVRVVSDDPQWCRENLGTLDRIATSVEFLENSPPHDLAVLASSRRLILSNSTFSYWGAYLGSIVHQGDSCVIAPAFHRRDLDGGRAWQLDPLWTVLEGFGDHEAEMGHPRPDDHDAPGRRRRVDPLETLITARPRFHEPETEVDRDFSPDESFLGEEEAGHLRSGELAHYGIGDDVLRYLAAEVRSGSRTLEIGAGSTTLVLAIRGARHTAVCPAADEVDRVRRYAADHGIDLSATDFVVQTSEAYLPGAVLDPLDLVLLDGKHAFPWPMLDWFFTAGALRTGGLLMVDDVQIRAVAVLDDFLRADPAWAHIADFGKTQVFRKLRDDVLDVAWHMQPWMRQDRGSSLASSSVRQDATALARRVTAAIARRVRSYSGGRTR